MIRTTQHVLFRAPGEHAKGRWVDGAETPGTIQASVQPAKKVDYDLMQAQLDGRRIAAAVRIYTDTRLNVAGENASNGDVLLWEGKRYTVAGVAPWRTTILAHYRYLAIMEPEK